jgi:hypothetical protein
MKTPNPTLNATFSPRLEPYPVFRLHLEHINAWLEAGHSVRSVWIACKENGAFPGCYRSFLRYCQKHRLPRFGSGVGAASRRDQNDCQAEDRNRLASRPRLVATNGVQVLEARFGREGPKSSAPKVSLSANSARPSKIYPLPFSRPPEFIPSEEI